MATNLVSLRLEDALKSFGVPPGRYRVVSSEWAVHKFVSTKDATKDFEPFVAWAIGYLPINEKGEATGEVEISYDIKVGPGFGETLDKSKFCPALSPTQPLPLRIGSKGPHLMATGDQKQLAEKSKPMLYVKELYKCGFDVNRLASSGFNVGLLVGTEGEIFELKSANDGTDEKTGEKFKDTKIPAFSKIYKFGYEIHGTPAANGTTAPAASATGSTAATGSDGDTKIAIEILSKIAEECKGKGVTKIPLTDAVKFVVAKWSKMTPRPASSVRDAAKVLIGSEEFYTNDDVLAIAVLDGETLEFM
jgi:hypothetical protein